MLLLKNGRVVDPVTNTDSVLDVLIADGIIQAVGKGIEADEAKIIDAAGLVVAPGLVDTHVHFRDPGLTYKEDIYTGASAAAKGGFTTVVCMANTKPTVDNVETLEYVQKKGQETGIHVLSAAAVTKGLSGKELVDMKALADAGAAGFTDDGIPILDEKLLKEAMEMAKELDLPISLHEEDPLFIAAPGVHQGEVSAMLNYGGASRTAEDIMVARDCIMALHTGASVCIQHISSGNSVELVRMAKKLGADIHAEATPHHFTLTDKAVVEYGTYARMNPPLRTEADRLAIIEGLKDGTIDMIVTDHAPHSVEEKAKPMNEAPSGITGLETSLALGIKSLVEPGHLTMLELMACMSKNPSEFYRMIPTSISEGSVADIVIFGEKDMWIVDKYASKAVNSPFTGWELPGKVHYTICNGKIVYQCSKIWNADLGNGMYKNPILYADYSDPDAIRVGEDYFMIASSFCNAPGLPVLHSKDLVNWKVIQYILPKVPTDRYDAPIHGCGVWAPSIRYHEGVYYACFPMPDEGIYMSTTKDPWGEWSEPVNIRPGAGWIDPCPFWDEDGKAYLVAGVAKSRIGYKSVLHMVEMQPDGMGLIGPEIKIFDGNENDQVTIEGPKMYKRNGWYYIFAPAGGVKTGWQTVMRSRNVFGPYEYRVVLRQGESAVNGPHQGAWVDTVTGEDWFLHFQDVYAAGRIVHLQPMCWVEDWPIIGKPVEGEIYGTPVDVYKKPNVGAVKWDICEPATSDDFSSDKLGLQWQWNANPKEDWYEIDNGVLKLKAVHNPKDMAYGDMPNLLLQKWPAPEFVCYTDLDLSQLENGDTAGVISMGMKYGLITFEKTMDAIKVLAVLGVQKYGKIVVDTTEEAVTDMGMLQGDKVTVRVTVKPIGTQDLSETEREFPLEAVTISYSTDKESYIDVLTMNAVPGRWVGVKNGPFCCRRDDKNGGILKVEKVEYTV